MRLNLRELRCIIRIHRINTCLTNFVGFLFLPLPLLSTGVSWWNDKELLRQWKVNHHRACTTLSFSPQPRMSVHKTKAVLKQNPDHFVKDQSDHSHRRFVCLLLSLARVCHFGIKPNEILLPPNSPYLLRPRGVRSTSVGRPQRKIRRSQN